MTGERALEAKWWEKEGGGGGASMTGAVASVRSSSPKPQQGVPCVVETWDTVLTLAWVCGG